MRIWRDNPLARYLIPAPEPHLRRRLILSAAVGFIVAGFFAALYVYSNFAGLSLTLACPLWIALLYFPGMVATRARKLAVKHIGTDKYEILRLTTLAPRQIITGFGLAALYQMRHLAALLYGALPGILLSSAHIYVWLSVGALARNTNPSLNQTALFLNPVVLLRIPILLAIALSTITVTMPAVSNQLWTIMAKNRVEFTPVAADLGVGLSFWALTTAQFVIPVLAILPRTSIRNQIPALIVLGLVACFLPLAHWLLARWMLRMADRRL